MAKNIKVVRRERRGRRKSEIFFRYNIPSTVTVEIDTREKRPIRFPSCITIPHPEIPRKSLLVAVKAERTKLPYGDYRLKEYPDCAVIERKGGQRELFKNLFDPRDTARQARSFRKLMECDHPFLLIELTPSEILGERPEIPDPEALLHRVALLTARYPFNVLWVPFRKYQKTSRKLVLGRFLVHIMLGCAVGNLELLPDLLL